MSESPQQFEKRKQDHIKIALDERTQTAHRSDLDKVALIHEALPEMDFEEVSTKTSFSFKNQNVILSSPIFISSMTAGHEHGRILNSRLAKLSEQKQILMGVGSQRRELMDTSAAAEWKQIKKESPQSLLVGNIGLAQLIHTSSDEIKRLIDNLQAVGLFIHLNALQEVMQPEGTPQFKNGLKNIERLVKELDVPVIVKETGCGFSEKTLRDLKATGIFAVDVAGIGGTHWGRIEGYRSQEEQMLYRVAQTFADWGHSAAESLLNAIEANVNYQVWASGGIRTGLDVAKMLAMGATAVGMAQPFLKAALIGESELEKLWEQLQYELKVAMFCTGVQSVTEFKKKRVWKWQKN
ncbi:MAG: type 2 isopentenyl-diphosphate Delta-isomerase [Bdellovibrionia bacterium]